MTDTEIPINMEKHYDLSKFKTEKILLNNSTRKSACVVGRFDNDDDDDNANDRALIILEKTAFTSSDLNIASNDDDDVIRNSSYFSCATKLKTDFVNDIYGNFQCFPKPELNCNCRPKNLPLQR